MSQRDKVIDVFSPVDGRLLKSYVVTPEKEIALNMATVREAEKIWADYSVKQRLKVLSPFKDIIIARMDVITEQLVRVTGKVKTDVVINEIYPVLEMLKFYQKQADNILASQRVMTSALTFSNADAYYQYHPYGVVTVISPWNLPFQLTLYPLLSALIAGNGVIFKTSELSLPIAELILALLAELDLPNNLVQAVFGAAETGQALINQRPDLIFFTGSHNTGRRIMAAAAQHPVPVVLELGGKDAMLVFADAPFERAINAAVYGAFANAGQICVSVEQLYVEQTLFSKFVAQLCQAVEEVKVGYGDEADFGAITSNAQLEIIEAHYQDAIAKGAKISSVLTIKGNYVNPVILWNVSEEMRILQEETFGPLLPVVAFTDENELIARLNAGGYGLNASVWSGNVVRAENIAQKLQVGNWAVNDVIKNIGHPRLPFGGVKNSGFGRYHGAEGLRNFCYPVSGLVSHSRFIKEPNWFPYSAQTYSQMKAFVDFLFASDSLIKRLKRNARVLVVLREYATLNLRQQWRNFMIFIFGIQTK